MIGTSEFVPVETPMGIPVLHSFEYRGRGYVVDYDGNLFQICADDPDPDMWTWQLVVNL